MNTSMIIGIVIILFLVYLIVIYNSLVRAKVRISEALSQIDVQLKRRTDLIPNLVETVKGYAKHEREVLTKITEARSAIMKAKTTQDKADANNMLSQSLKSLFAVAENYPDLKASQNFMELQEELSDTEDKIAYSRQFLNSNVMDYNTRIKTFPGNLFANMFGFEPADFFAASDADKKPVKVSFS